MENKSGFTKIATNEFSDWLSHVTLTRTIKGVQQHHTWSPNYGSGLNHFQIQKGMKDFHIQQRGFSDIAQHFSIFKDGSILTGRGLDMLVRPVLILSFFMKHRHKTSFALKLTYSPSTLGYTSSTSCESSGFSKVGSS